MQNPLKLLETLQLKPYNFKLKGSGPLQFHLGCGFRRDDDGKLVMDPGKYIQKMMTGYQQMFGDKPRVTYQSPLEGNNHPELDNTEFLDNDGMQKYQSASPYPDSVQINWVDIHLVYLTHVLMGSIRM